MRGLDTNILLRLLTRDDPEQTPRAEKVLSEAQRTGESLFVSTVVLCELVWALRGARFGRSRAEISQALAVLLNIPTFEVQNRREVRRALAAFDEGRADFADYLLGELARNAGCRDTLTFDKALQDDIYFMAPPDR